MKKISREEQARLRRAYMAAIYCADLGDGPFDMRIGKVCWSVARYFKANWRGRRTAAFITAFNPLGQLTDPEVNAREHERLRAILRRSGRPVFEGEGKDPAGAWLPEKSLLVFGLSESRCEKLMRQFRQLAYVFIESDCIPQLRWTCLNPTVLLMRKRQLLMAGVAPAKDRASLFMFGALDQAPLDEWEDTRKYCSAWSAMLDDLCEEFGLTQVSHAPESAMPVLRERVRQWLNEPPSRSDWDSTGQSTRSTPEGAAMDFFSELPANVCDALGVEIVEGEHPGSSYEAAELTIPMAQANAAARKLRLDIRFERAAPLRRARVMRSPGAR